LRILLVALVATQADRRIGEAINRLVDLVGVPKMKDAPRPMYQSG